QTSDPDGDTLTARWTRLNRFQETLDLDSIELTLQDRRGYPVAPHLRGGKTERHRESAIECDDAERSGSCNGRQCQHDGNRHECRDKARLRRQLEVSKDPETEEHRHP